MFKTRHKSRKTAPLSKPIKLIVIHGWGGTFIQAIHTIKQLGDFEVHWQDGTFVIPRRIALIISELLSTQNPDQVTAQLQKLIVSQLLTSCETYDAKSYSVQENMYHLSEKRVLSDFGHLGIPLTPSARIERAKQLRTEATEALQAVMHILDTITESLKHVDGTIHTEPKIRKIITNITTPNPETENLILLLESIRDMHETGGDLDTVSSAVFYTLQLASETNEQKESFLYGKDYKYIFINYHESLRHLAKEGPAEIYMADLPIGAFPEFDNDVRYLYEHDVIIKRFEDHHPYTPEHVAMFEKLQADGILEYFALSAPADGGEPTNPLCGADMVFGNLTPKMKSNTGVLTIKRCAHAEDYVTNRTHLSKMLTNLIKGGICKIELVQLLINSIKENNAPELLAANGWNKLPSIWDESYKKQEVLLLENSSILKFKRSDKAIADQGNSALGLGSDVPQPAGKVKDSSSIIVVLAPHSKKGEPRITTGKATEFIALQFPDADYLFYCYGSSIMVARRLNQADFSFNLGKLMPLIGSPSDGGHSGAAVCRPESSPKYPSHILANISSANFNKFVRYLGQRVSEQGYELLDIENKQIPASQNNLRQGGKKLLIITVIAAIIGIILSLLHPKFRPAAILKSNQNFFPQIGIESPKEGILNKD